MEGERKEDKSWGWGFMAVDKSVIPKLKPKPGITFVFSAASPPFQMMLSSQAHCSMFASMPPFIWLRSPPILAAI